MSGVIDDPSTWVPDETPDILFSERVAFAGIFLSCVAYGVHLTIFFWCLNIFYTKKRSRHDWWQLIYICVVFVLSTIGNATYVKYAQETWIDNRNYPGGPNAFYWDGQTDLTFKINDGVYIPLTWIQDGLLLYRLWVICGGKWYFVVLPTILLLVSIVFSVYLLVILMKPGITFQSNLIILIGIPFWSISIANNVYITAVIAGRLLMMRRRLKVFNGLGNGQTYLSITAILVESAALYTVNGILFIIPFALKSPVQNLFLPLLGQSQANAPVLVILRSLLGRAWTSETAAQLTTRTVGGPGVAFNNSTTRRETAVELDVFKDEPYKSSLHSKKSEIGGPV